eukprot:4461182-Pyramimonas_sp.AAC.1
MSADLTARVAASSQKWHFDPGGFGPLPERAVSSRPHPRGCHMGPSSGGVVRSMRLLTQTRELPGGQAHPGELA